MHRSESGNWAPRVGLPSGSSPAHALLALPVSYHTAPSPGSELKGTLACAMSSVLREIWGLPIVDRGSGS